MSGLTIRERARAANAVIKIIASHGKRAFYAEAWDRYATLGLDGYEQVWLVSETSGMKLYPFGTGRWAGFTHGREFQMLMNGLAEFVRDGQLVPLPLFGKWDGYSEENMVKVRELAQKTGAL